VVVESNLDTPPTSKGRETRQRIVDAAADLFHTRGVAKVSLDDLRHVTGVSKSQLYHYFDDKDDLVLAVIECQRQRVLGFHRELLASLSNWDDLVRWRNLIVATQAARNCRGGCPLGSLASELSELDDTARIQLANAFTGWEKLIADGIDRMINDGALRSDADSAILAIGFMASLQGGLLLAEVGHDTRPLEVALDAALAHLRSFSSSSRPPDVP
jgi:TetR/AcrR family transcriptional regulator, transcriptional repressor for nem operon